MRQTTKTGLGICRGCTEIMRRPISNQREQMLTSARPIDPAASTRTRSVSRGETPLAKRPQQQSVEEPWPDYGVPRGAAGLWWLYFDVVALVAEHRLTQAPVGRARNTMARDSYSYLHFPMVAGIVLVALGMKTTSRASRIR
jgi:hypothetical protein